MSWKSIKGRVLYTSSVTCKWVLVLISWIISNVDCHNSNNQEQKLFLYVCSGPSWSTQPVNHGQSSLEASYVSLHSLTQRLPSSLTQARLSLCRCSWAQSYPSSLILLEGKGIKNVHFSSSLLLFTLNMRLKQHMYLCNLQYLKNLNDQKNITQLVLNHVCTYLIHDEDV